MPLEETCEKYLGNKVFVLPGEGYGWARFAPDAPRFQTGESIEVPQPFHIRVAEFHRFLGKIRAGIAVVEEEDHPLDKQWMAFCIRDGMGSSTHNLSSNPAEYNLSIGTNKPMIQIDPENLAMPEWIRFEHSTCLSGLGYITETRSSLEEIFKRIRNVRFGC